MGHRSADGTDVGLSIVEKGLSDVILVDEVGRWHDGSAATMVTLRAQR